MNIRINSCPEDFIVKEKMTLIPAEKGLYTVYLLKKTGGNTLDAMGQIARAWELRHENCGFGGNQDRWGRTEQYITVKGGEKKGLELRGITVEFVGYADRAMGPDAVQGNLYTTVVRDLSDADALAASHEAVEVTRTGFVNYFDDQRFSYYDERQGFLAEKLLKNHLSSVLKTYLVSLRVEDKKDERERKVFFNEHWKDWQACLGKAKTSFEKRVFARLVNDAKGYQGLIEAIPVEDMKMAVAAYQGFLWNEVVRSLLTARGWAQCSYQGVAGAYIFFRKIKGQDYEYLKDMTLLHPGSKVEMPDKILSKIYEKVLAAREIQAASFNTMKIRNVFFKGSPRRVVIKPQEITTYIEDDERFAGRKKLTLGFFLPKGTYATMFLKRIFASDLPACS